MTQKAVVNAIVSMGLYTGPNRFNDIYIDNCNSAPELFVMLKAKYKILPCGTVWMNRKDWDQNVMNL